MIGPLKKSPRQLEWKALEKREERFITAARHQKEPLLNRKLEHFVPEKLEDTLNLAFYKAFELIFNRGTSIIEKTYRKEDMENTYKILFLIFTVIGASSSLGVVMDFSDMMILAMAVPNIIGMYFLSGEVRKDLASYLRRLKSGEIKKYK